MPKDDLKLERQKALGTKKIIIAGGGTGGHIFPALAIAGELKRQMPGVNILFVGAKGKMEMEKIPEAGFPIIGLTIAGYNRSSLIKNLSLPLKLIRSFIQVNNILNSFKPDAVVGVGGYSSFPVLRMAQAKNIATFIHESNSYPGKSNILLGKRAVRVFVASRGMEKYFPAGKTMVVGNPVRKNIIHSGITRSEAIRFFGLMEEKKTILAIGGSLGAKSINEALASHIDEFGTSDLQLIWQTGKATLSQYKGLEEGRPYLWVNDFISQMDYAYSAADIIISRSGGTIYELCVVGKPAVLVPYPFAAEDHQTANAMQLVQGGAAIMIRDQDAQEKLVEAVIGLSRNEALQQNLKTHIRDFAITDSDEVIAKEIIEKMSI